MKNPEAPSQKPAIGRRDFMKLGAGATGASALLGTLAGGNAAASPAAPAAPQAAKPNQSMTYAPWLSKGSTKPVSIDAHSHWVPEAYAKAMAAIGKGTTPDPMAIDLKQRIAWMDERGVQMLVLALDGGMPWWYLAPDTATRFAQLVTDAGSRAHEMYPDRFIVAMELPVFKGKPDFALKELDRAAGKPGVKAVHMPDSLNGQDYLFDPAYDALYAKLEQLGLPIVFHPLDGAVNVYGGTESRLTDPMSLNFNFGNLLGFPFETATMATKFIVSGVLDRFPKLDIVLPHSGGCFPYVAGRVGYGLERRKFPLKHPYREYIRRFHYDVLAYYPEQVRFMVDLLGSDRLMVGTDNQFRGENPIPYPNAMVEMLNLSAEDTDRMLRGNARKLFKL